MITLVIGRQGSGKTLYLVNKAYNYYKEGRKIYSNIHLKNIPYELINVQDIIDCNYKNAVVILDEIHLLISNRDSMKKMNKSITNGFLSMVRKMDLIILGSSQTVRKVDVKFLDETDLLVKCKKQVYIKQEMNGKQVGGFVDTIASKGFNKFIPIRITLEILDIASLEEGYPYQKCIIHQYFLGNPLFDLFDTKEIVKIIGIDNKSEDNITKENIKLKKENKRIKSIINEAEVYDTFIKSIKVKPK